MQAAEHEDISETHAEEAGAVGEAGFHDVEELTNFGINSVFTLSLSLSSLLLLPLNHLSFPTKSDVKKLKEAGFYSVEGLIMQTKKVHATHTHTHTLSLVNS